MFHVAEGGPDTAVTPVMIGVPPRPVLTSEKFDAVKPPIGSVKVTCQVTFADPVGLADPLFIETTAGVGVGVGVGVPPELKVIVKFVLEISKKMLPTASTLMRAVVVGRLGTVIAWLPSLAVSATTVGKLKPPSVDNSILTVAALTGAEVVLATFHVTVCVEFPAHETLVLGEVTTKGPLLPATDTSEKAELIPPLLLRATTWKLIVLATAGSSSPVRNPPVVAGGTLALFRICSNAGNVRFPSDVG